VRAFEHDEVTSFAEVRRKMRRGAVLIAGGTDLVPLMRDGLVTPRVVVDLKPIRGGAGIRASRAGAAVGALALVADVAAHAGVKRWYPALAVACEAVGTTQIRNMATLGGNLCQRVRCWYFRQNVPCHKTGGRGCPAVDGLNEYLAIFGDEGGGGPCHAPHPSDPAVALAALDAVIHVRPGRSGIPGLAPGVSPARRSRAGRRADPARKRGDPGAIRLSIADLYRTAHRRRDSETILRSGDVIERITVAAKFAGARQVYLKATQRAEWDFALVSVCVVWPKGKGAAPRVVVGGVAPAPWEVPVAEAGRGKIWAERVADAAVATAKPLSQNGFKVDLARNLIREALTA
jgi:xanthine dehydrogenase YagS FAD-binding subunit